MKIKLQTYIPNEHRHNDTQKDTSKSESYDPPAISPQHTQLIDQQDNCTIAFMASQFTTPKIWNQPNYHHYMDG